jgi:NitT/TauT family transport system substrate-binding protein
MASTTSKGNIVMFRKSAILAGAALLLAAGTLTSFAQDELKDVTVRFTWKYKGEYAPLFVALDKGYYAEEGLNVTLAEGSGSQTVISLVATGEEQIGYGPADAVASAVNRDIPVKVVSVYQTELPIALISFPDNPVTTPKDLEGKSIAGATSGAFTRLLPAFAAKNDLDLSKIEVVMLDGAVGNTQFLARQVDVASPYLSNEVPRLEKMAGVEFVKLPVADHGLPLMGASIFTSDAYAEAEPDTLRALLAATDKGYRDAIADPVEAAEIMMKYLPAGEDAEILQKQVEATVVSTSIIDGRPIGWQADEDWESTLALLAETGQIETVLPLDSYFTNAFFE